MKNKIYIGFTIIVLAIITLLIMRPDTKKNEDQLKDLKANSEEKKSFVKVKTMPLYKRPLVMYINTTGTASARKRVDVYPQVSGFVKKVFVEENSEVKKGDILFTLENEDYVLAYERQKDNLLKSKIDYGVRKNQRNGEKKEPDLKKYDEKLSELSEKWKSGELSEEEYADMKLETEIDRLFESGGSSDVLKSSTGLTQALISYKQAKIDLDRTVVRAPSSGYIADPEVVAGQYVGSGTKTMTIVDYDRIKMEIPVLESEIDQLSTGRKVEVKFEAMRDTLFTGKIKSINPVIDRSTGTGQVTVLIPNNDLRIKPGMSGSVKIEGRIYSDRLIIPNEAVLTRDNRKLVFTAVEGKAKWIYVDTGLSNYNFTEIIQDKDDPKLKIGDQIIVTNNYTLAHDADVKVIDTISFE